MVEFEIRMRLVAGMPSQHALEVAKEIARLVKDEPFKGEAVVSFTDTLRVSVRNVETPTGIQQEQCVRIWRDRDWSELDVTPVAQKLAEQTHIEVQIMPQMSPSWFYPKKS